MLQTKTDVVDYVKSQDSEFGATLDKEWEGGANNPEKSDNSSKGRFIAIDANGVAGAAKNVGFSQKQMGGLIINHGAGHVAELDHSGGSVYDPNYNSSPIMYDGNKLRDEVLGGKTYDEIVGNGPAWENGPGRNRDYFAGIKERFGLKKANDNYAKNKAKAEEPKIYIEPIKHERDNTGTGSSHGNRGY